MSSSSSCLDSLYFLDAKGDIIVTRCYRDDVGRDMADVFKKSVLQNPSMEGTAPVKNLGSCNFVYAKYADVTVLCVSNKNSNAAMCFHFIRDMVQLMRGYFGAFNEDAIRNNFVLVYELLDEIMDFGFPQVLNERVLKTYITQQGTRVDAGAGTAGAGAGGASLNSMSVTGAVTHRREGIKYKRNEVFLDIVEDVNLLVSQQGTILKSDVQGRVVVKSALSGMPSLKLGLNDAAAALGASGGGGASASGAGASGSSRKRIALDDVVFHQCVNLTKFASEKVVTFTPPDGEFELMRYRTSENVHVPFKVFPNVKELGRQRLEVKVNLKSLYSAKLVAMRVLVKIPVPKYTARVHCDLGAGKFKYDASHNMLVWKLKRFPGQADCRLSASLELVSTLRERKPWVQPPIQLDFSIPMYTSSGLQVLYLKVWEKAGYEATKWVRKITQAGDFAVRCS